MRWFDNFFTFYYCVWLKITHGELRDNVNVVGTTIKPNFERIDGESKQLFFGKMVIYFMIYSISIYHS